MPVILPQLIYSFGAVFAFFQSIKILKISNVVLSVLAFITLIFVTEPQVAYTVNFFDHQVIFFNADRTSLFMGYIFAFMAVLISIYSLHVNKKIHHILSMLFIASAMGMVFAGDLISFYLFGEIMMIIATVLICYNKDKSALSAGIRYFILHFIGSLFLLAGILIHYSETGNLDINSISEGVPAFLILAGIGVNAAFIPFHSWLPDAYSNAPFETSLLLSVFTTKIAVYALARIFPGVESIAYMGAAMALFGVIMALRQSDARKLLSYHVLSQVGFMVAGVGMGTFLGIDGALYHAFNNILYKTLLFMCVGAVIYRTGKQDLSELGGFAFSMPVTTIACIIAALSISGVPLFNGYASKAILYEASYKSALLLWSLKLASIGTFISFSKFTYFGFLRTKQVQVKEAPYSMTVPMVLLSLLCVIGGIYPKLVTVMLPYYTDFSVYLPSKVVDAFVFTTAAAIIFFIGMKSIFTPHKVHYSSKSTIAVDMSNLLTDFVANPLEKIKVLIFNKLADLKSNILISKIPPSKFEYIGRTSDFDKSILLLAATIAVLLIYMILR